MFIIKELDVTGIKEAIEIIPLNFVSATYAKNILEDIKKAITNDNKVTQFVLDEQKENSIIFPSGTVVQVDPNSNRLIIMGKPNAITALKKLITTQLDKKLICEDSPIYVYDELKYLNAEDCVKLLNAIISGQSSSDAQSSGTKSEVKSFGPMIIKNEPQVTTQKAAPPLLGQVTIEDFKGLSDTTYYGGNRILIAGSKADQLKVIDLIKKLDVPEPQVIIEILIVDLVGIKQNAISTVQRNRIKCPGDNGLDYLSFNGMWPNSYTNSDGQSAPFTTSGVIPGTPSSPNSTIASDLLYILDSGSTSNPGPCFAAQPGSLILSLNDNGTYSPGVSGVMAILESKFNTKLVSQPTIVSNSGQISTITQKSIRRLSGDPYTAGGGVPTIPVVDINATLGIQVLPRIISKDKVSIEMAMTINQFSSSNTTNGSRITRQLNTNFNIHNGEILVLGGLKQLKDTDQENETPLLSKLPVIGWLWRSKAKKVEDDNIMIFLIPTIVMSNERSKRSEIYTEKKLRDSALYMGDRALNHDPIDRVFFQGMNIEKNVIEDLRS